MFKKAFSNAFIFIDQIKYGWHKDENDEEEIPMILQNIFNGRIIIYIYNIFHFIEMMSLYLPFTLLNIERDQRHTEVSPIHRIPSINGK